MNDIERDRRISDLEKRLNTIEPDLRFLIRHMIKTKAIPTTELQALEKRYMKQGEE